MAKSSDKAPAFQFYVKDYETDENVKLMSLAQEGAFLRLLCHQWLHRSVPANLDQLARICRVSTTEFEPLWAGIRPCFVDVEGRLVNERMERQRNDTQDFSSTMSALGQMSAAKRKEKYGTAQPSNRSTVREPISDRSDSSTNGSTNDAPNVRSGLSNDNPNRSSNGSRTETLTVAEPASASASAKERHAHPREAFGPSLVDRAHLSHAECGRVCVPDFLHRDFVKAIGGAQDVADERVRVWYREVLKSLPENVAVPSDAVKFWRPRFDQKFAPDAMKPQTPRRTLVDAADLRKQFEVEAKKS